MKHLISFFLVFSLTLGISFTSQAQTALKSDTFDIIHYSINLDMVYLSKKSIKGYVDIRMKPKISSISKVSLDLLKLTTDSVRIGQSLRPFTHNDTLLRISLATPAGINDTLQIRVYYHGTPIMESSGWGGFHFATDSSWAYNLGVAFTAVPHSYARVWFPCIDDFTEKASIECHIRVKSDKMAVCGGVLDSVSIHGNGTKTYHWRLNQEIPVYLASVAVGKFFPVTKMYNGMLGTIPVTAYVPAADTAKARLSLKNIQQILSVYEQRFGPYRWPRVGYVSTSIGAMEHATNIAMNYYAFDGTLNYEWLFSHELSHHWFGNLVTCATAGDMWLNEGWAVFSEFIMKEGLYGNNVMKDYIRAKLEEVLQYAHTTSNSGDGSYLALYGIPDALTYGTTVYDKGGLVAHTLRAYLGDSLFFGAIKAYLNQFAFNNANTFQFRDFLSNYTGVSMNDFFDAWVFRSGFPHFSIDSFKVNYPTSGKVRVYFRQKLKGTQQYALSNKIPVRFIGSNWQKWDAIATFSGKTGFQDFQPPFLPVTIFIDPEEKIADATTDCYKVIKTTGKTAFSSTKFELDVVQINDSALVRVEHNWVPPDSLKIPIAGLTLSNYRYWKIDGIFPVGFQAKGRFAYSKANYLDNVLLADTKDSLIILYRSCPGQDWQPVSFTRSGSAVVGNIITQTLQKGEYTLAVWDDSHLAIQKNTNKSKSLIITPNPSADKFRIESNLQSNGIILFYSSDGKLLDSICVKAGKSMTEWLPPSNVKGQMIIVELREGRKLVATEKIISAQ